MQTPAFIITIDVEGDNLWHNRREIHTKNARYLSRFQSLCEHFDFKPVWLTNYEMAQEPVCIEFLKDVLSRKKGELGMHLHAWNTPPEYNLTGDDSYWHPYLIEFPDTVMREKILYMTRLLEETFDSKISSHRAGRWALDDRYVKLLIEFNYTVDCSVTPRVNWRSVKGSPEGIGGIDYRYFPDCAYFINKDNIAQNGSESILEVPMSIQYKYPVWINTVKRICNCIEHEYYSPSVNWLRPNGKNLIQMVTVAQKYLNQGNDYIEFMLHSSELMPGGSPTFKDEIAIENLYQDLWQLFEWIAEHTKGMTLSEFWQWRIQRIKSSILR